MGEERERGWIFVENLKALMDRERASKKKEGQITRDGKREFFYKKDSSWGFPRGVWKIEMGRQS